MIKCYKYNSNACCTSVHDDYITNYISSLLTNSCVRKYKELESFVCYGCNPKEFLYTDPQAKVLNFCLSFALRLWNATTIEDLSKPSDKYDNCGIKVGSDSPQKLQELTDKPYIIPSEVIKFLNLVFPEFLFFRECYWSSFLRKLHSQNN